MAKLCQVCHAKILSHSKIISCICCKECAHISCYSLNRDEAQELIDWLCKTCLNEALPYYHLDDEEYKSAVYAFTADTPLDFTIINNLVFNPFEFNEEPFPLCDIDPDNQYFSGSQFSNIGKCEYFPEEALVNVINTKLNSDAGAISLYHHNIRSLPQNFMGMCALLDNINYSFDFIGLTETWLNSTNYDLFQIRGYQEPYQKYREKRKGGGVIMYVKDHIRFKIRSDLTFTDDTTEDIFIEIDKDIYNTPKPIVIGVVYRAPFCFMYKSTVLYL